jgi:hypothetical protein
MQCKEWDDENSELFKESHDEAVHKNSYKSRLYELISASLGLTSPLGPRVVDCPTGKTTHWIFVSLSLPYSTAITDSQ